MFPQAVLHWYIVLPSWFYLKCNLYFPNAYSEDVIPNLQNILQNKGENSSLYSSLTEVSVFPAMCCLYIENFCGTRKWGYLAPSPKDKTAVGPEHHPAQRFLCSRIWHWWQGLHPKWLLSCRAMQPCIAWCDKKGHWSSLIHDSPCISTSPSAFSDELYHLQPNFCRDASRPSESALILCCDRPGIPLVKESAVSPCLNCTAVNMQTLLRTEVLKYWCKRKHADCLGPSSCRLDSAAFVHMGPGVEVKRSAWLAFFFWGRLLTFNTLRRTFAGMILLTTSWK